jgi:hypothetical protein
VKCRQESKRQESNKEDKVASSEGFFWNLAEKKLFDADGYEQGNVNSGKLWMKASHRAQLTQSTFSTVFLL